MRRDLIIGTLISLAIHTGLAFSGKAPPPKKRAAEDTKTIALMEMPKVDPDEPEPQESDEKPPTPADFAPPMLADVPSLVTENSIVQQIAPPPPEGLRPNSAVFTIPENRNVGLGSGVKIFDASSLDTQPAPISQPEPVFPFEMKRAGIPGDVVVEFIVDTNGNVLNPVIVRSSQREFEANAISAVNKWRFKPGKKGGRSVVTRMSVEITFKLNDN